MIDMPVPALASTSPPSSHPPAHPTRAFDVERIRGDFPILALSIAGKPLVYLDNAA
jgi:cysteine desulfurase/selenocysteine lyase